MRNFYLVSHQFGLQTFIFSFIHITMIWKLIYNKVSVIKRWFVTINKPNSMFSYFFLVLTLVSHQTALKREKVAPENKLLYFRILKCHFMCFLTIIIVFTRKKIESQKHSYFSLVSHNYSSYFNFGIIFHILYNQSKTY